MRLNPIPLASVILLISSCAAPDYPALTRFIEAEPPEVLRSTAVTATESTFTWSFNDADDLAPFTLLSPDGDYQVRDGMLVVRAVGPDPYLGRPLGLEAASVDRIEIQLGRPTLERLYVFWARAGEPFSEERMLASSTTDPTQDTLVFETSSHPLWEGHINRLRFDPTSTAGVTIGVRQVRGVTVDIQPDLVARAATLPWKLRLGREVRNVLVSTPDAPVEKEVLIPPDADLRFGIALWNVTRDTPGPTLFRASFVGGDGSAQTLFETTIDPGQADTRWFGWHDHRVDLSALEGSRGRIVLEAWSETPGPLASLSLWSNPELVRRDAPSRGPNVILISVDTLRADRLSPYGYKESSSPEIAAWAAGGVVFQNTIASASWTLPSHVSIFTGLDAVRHGVNYHAPAPGALTTLAEYFHEAGYATGAITGGGFVGPQYGLDQGFDSFRYWGERALYGEDRELTDNLAHAAEYIRARADRQFFLFFHTYEVHSPYRPRPPYNGPYVDDDPDRFVQLHQITPDLAEGYVTREVAHWHDPTTRRDEALPLESRFPSDLYDAGVTYADAQLGSLFRLLRELELDSNTLVVLTADHGELLGERGDFGHVALYDEVLRVPLIFVLPGRIEGGLNVETQVRSIDILPTILEILELPEPPNIDGTSLVPLIADDSARHPEEAWSYVPLTNRGMSLRLANQTKFIFNNTALPPVAGDAELYDLRTDPNEMNNLADSSELTPSLRARVLEKSEEVVGMRLTVRNTGPDELTGVVRGERNFPPTTIKFLECPGGCVTWRGDGVRFAVAPGDSITLLLENVPPEGFYVRSLPRTGPDESFELFVTPGSEESFWGMAYGQGGWFALGPADPFPARGFVVEAQGLRLEALAEAELDEETRRQLRALGYLRD